MLPQAGQSFGKWHLLLILTFYLGRNLNIALVFIFRLLLCKVRVMKPRWYRLPFNRSFFVRERERFNRLLSLSHYSWDNYWIIGFVLKRDFRDLGPRSWCINAHLSLFATLQVSSLTANRSRFLLYRKSDSVELSAQGIFSQIYEIVVLKSLSIKRVRWLFHDDLRS